MTRELGAVARETPPRRHAARVSWPYEFTLEVTDAGSQTVDVSDGLLELYGYTKEELSRPEAWRVLVPDEAELVKDIMAQVLAGHGWEGRVRIRTKDGDPLVVESTADLELETDDRTVIKGLVRDVTDQVILETKLNESEARLKFLNERFRMVMWSCDPQLRLTSLWGSALADLGQEANEVVGMTLYEYFGLDDPEFLPIAAHLRALEGERLDYELEWKERRYRCWVEPCSDPRGVALGIIGFALDITEQRSFEQESKELGPASGAPPTAREAARSGEDDEIIEVGDVRIDVAAFQVTRAGQEIKLTPTEFRLLLELARHPGRVLTRDVLMWHVWGQDFLGGGSLITMAISRLRSKIERDSSYPELIETVRGIGYRMRRS